MALQVGAISSTGSGQVVDRGKYTIAASKGFSISFWFKLNGYVTTPATNYIFRVQEYKGIALSGIGNGNNSSIIALQVSPGTTALKLTIDIRTGGTTISTVVYDDALSLSTSIWQHIVITFKSATASGLKLFVNNSEVTATSGTTNITGSTTGSVYYQLGWANQTTTTFSTDTYSFAEMAIWDSIQLTTTEISSLYKGVNPLTIRPTSLSTYRPLRSEATTLYPRNSQTNLDVCPVLYDYVIYGSNGTSITHNIPFPATVPSGYMCLLFTKAGLGAATVTITAVDTGVWQKHGSSTSQIGEAASMYRTTLTTGSEGGTNVTVTLSEASEFCAFLLLVSDSWLSGNSVTGLTSTTVAVQKGWKSPSEIVFIFVTARQSAGTFNSLSGFSLLGVARTNGGTTNDSDVQLACYYKTGHTGGTQSGVTVSATGLSAVRTFTQLLTAKSSTGEIIGGTIVNDHPKVYSTQNSVIAPVKNLPNITSENPAPPWYAGQSGVKLLGTNFGT